jgi:hypothetical protein
MKRKLEVLFAMVSLAVMCLFCCVAYADTLSGTLTISYSDSSGVLSATYSGDTGLKNPTFTWYKDGSSVSTAREYTPNSPGRYYCELKDDSYTNTLTSTTRIDLYQVTGSNITQKNNNGLYEAGKTVTITAKVNNTNEKVVNWRTNVAGIEMPATGNTVSFKMPYSDVVVTAEIKASYKIKTVGGTADKYTASPGETVTVTASDVDGKKFTTWTTTGGSISNAQSSTATITMPSKDIQVTANFTELTPEEAAEKKAKESGIKFSDPTRLLYTTPWSNNYKITMKHAKQGPACDLAFKLAAAGDFLVLDYFNITINDNPNIMEIPTPVTICLTLPADLQWAGRNWRVLCVSRGRVYSFPDEDTDDTTVTFSPDRFYAFALAYNDKKPEPIVEESPVEEEPEEVIKITYDPSLASTTEEREAESSAPSTSHSISDSHTIDGAEVGAMTKGSGLATQYSTVQNVDSDKQAAIRNANGARLATLPL